MAIATLDDRDVTITYTPPAGWAKGGSANELNSTTSWTAVAGSTATVKFTGTSIGVFGTIGASKGVRSVAPISSYSIDGGAAVLFRATQAATAQYRKLFFQSPTLTNGAHTLTITHPAVSDPFFLDFLQVVQLPLSTPTVPVIPPVNATTTTATTPTTTIATTPTTTTTPASTTSTPIVPVVPKTTATTPVVPQTVTVTSVQAASTTSSADTTTKSNGSDLSNADNTAAAKNSNGGAIAGGIIGAILALFLIGFGIIIWRRRRRERRNSMISSNFWNTNARAAPVDVSEEVPVVPVKPFASSSPPQSPRSSNVPPMIAQAPAMNQSPHASHTPQMMAQVPPPNPYTTPRYPGGYAPTPPPVQAPGYGSAYAPHPPPPNAPYGAPAYGGGYDQAYAADAYAHEQAYAGNAYGREQGPYGHEHQPYGGNAYASPSQLQLLNNNGYGRR